MNLHEQNQFDALVQPLFLSRLLTRRQKKSSEWWADVSALIAQPQSYQYLMQMFQVAEIYPDVVLYDVEQAKYSNLRLKQYREDIYQNMREIASNAQGDVWLLSHDDVIYFYDRDNGEITIEYCEPLNICFVEFIQISLIIKKFEEMDGLSGGQSHQQQFIADLEAICPHIYHIFPYAYF